MEKKFIRVCMYPHDINGKKIEFTDYSYRAGDKYCTTLDSGFFEDLIFGEDDCKINMYNSAIYISMMNGKTYKVTKRVFQPCIPCMLKLYIQEIE
ncbi:hypothetical protein [uncultured Ruminococcus sp.]|uniref:hypothetical protein n=1 Tax=uncultured Ruminococcus sp. TaxID=165186 RepID=UPI0025D3F732|nr:hypothetical protein [uncultured Ruminococcus sp.]